VTPPPAPRRAPARSAPVAPAGKRIDLAGNQLGPAEIEAVTGVLRSGWLSAGPQTRAFEQEFAAALGVPDAVAVSSGTAALHLAVRSLRLVPGDQVILPSLSFVAAAAMVVLEGGTPVFADVCSEQDLTVDPERVRGLVTGRTRAIVAMHYGGYPADLVALRRIAGTHALQLIEDAAHAPVVRYAPATAAATGPAVLGALGDLGCFSFFATKNLTTGEGGMVVARDRTVLEWIRRARSHALTTSTWDRHQSGDTGYDVPEVGLNYRPTEITAAIGRVQLGRLPAEREHRRRLVTAYRELLAAVPGLVVPFAGHAGDCAHHLLAVLLPPGTDRAHLRAALTRAGIQTSVHYPPTHQLSLYRTRYPAAAGTLPVTERVAGRLLSLPLHTRMSVDDAALVARALAGQLGAPAGS
jgi:dTDP-4-amino-4,6-dideoxygalactose transaminase